MSLPPSPVLALPTELLDSIVDVAGPETLKTLRLASKEFHCMATPRLFAEYHMGLFQYALDNLEAIATSPLAKHIQKVTLHCDILPDWTKEKWRLYNGVQVDTHATDQAYQLLTKLRQEQFEWHLSRIKSLRFRECFARLDCIKEAEVLRAQDVDVDDLNAPATRYWNSLQQKILIRPEGSTLLGLCSPATDSLVDGSELASLNLMSALVFRSSFSGTQPVTRVILSDLDHSFGRYLALDFGRQLALQGNTYPGSHTGNPSYPLFKIPCTNFTELSLVSKDIPLSTSVPFSDWIPLLRQSINLHRLRLSCRRSPASLQDLRTHVLDELFEGNANQPTPMTWPHLEDVQLSIEISHVALMSFLRRHANTLRVIRLLRTLILGDIGPCLDMLTQNFDVEQVRYSPRSRFRTLDNVVDRHHDETSLIGRRKSKD